MWCKFVVNWKTAVKLTLISSIIIFILINLAQAQTQAGEEPLLTPSYFPFITYQVTPTPQTEPTIVVQKGTEAMHLAKRSWENNEIHVWPFVVGVGEVVTVTAVANTQSHLILSLLDQTNTALVEATASAGDVATISQFYLSTPGNYFIQIETEDRSPADYALMLLFADSLNFIFQPIITYGVSETVNLPINSEHFWHFTGQTADQILITVDPDNNTDVFLELYDTDGNRLSEPFISVGTQGVTEQLELTLPEDGLYSIRVGEWNFDAGSYELTLVEN